jgi:hypothetical protein
MHRTPLTLAAFAILLAVIVGCAQQPATASPTAPQKSGARQLCDDYVSQTNATAKLEFIDKYHAQVCGTACIDSATQFFSSLPYRPDVPQTLYPMLIELSNKYYRLKDQAARNPGQSYSNDTRFSATSIADANTACAQIQ